MSQSIATATKGTRPSASSRRGPVRKYNPAPLRRHIQREGLTPDGIVFQRIKSMTRPNVNTKTGEVAPAHKIEVDLQGAVAKCSCENFCFKRSPGGNPVSFRFPQLWCKHITKALEACERRGEVRFIYSEGELMEAETTGFSFDETVVLRRRQPSGAEYDLEHADYYSTLGDERRRRNELMEGVGVAYSSEIEEDESPHWFERATARYDA